jgi:hypothetical protein
MNWVKQKYDIVLLAIATLLLTANAGWIVMNRIQPTEPEFKVSAPKDNTVAALDLNAIRQASALAESPLKWKSQSDLPAGTPERGSLLVSRRYLLKDGKLIDPLAEGSDQLHPPITNDWLLVNGLDYTDINIKEKDADGDGFSNLEEFKKKTNPIDPKDAPPSLNKLKLVSYNPIPFRLGFKGASFSVNEIEDSKSDFKDTTFQINLKDLKGSARSQFLKLGEQVKGAPYNILKYEPKPGPNGINASGDLSELTLQNTETGNSISLVLNKEKDDPTSIGWFRNLLAPGDADFKLKEGEGFTIKPDNSRKLKLTKITNDGAEVQDISTGEIFSVFSIDKLSP